MGKRGWSEQERTLRGAQTLALAVILLAFAMCSDCSQRSRVSALDGFWMPFERRSAVLISVPDLDTQVLSDRREMPDKVMSTTDVQAAVAISSFLASKGTPARLCRRGDRTFQGARNSPVVVIGALTEGFPEHPGLHFTFSRGEGDRLSIREMAAPWRNWAALEDVGHAASSPPDYGLVSRLFDEGRGRTIVAIGGIGGPGTQAAVGCVTSNACLAAAIGGALADWQRGNLQFVVGCQGRSTNGTAPEIEAAYRWESRHVVSAARTKPKFLARNRPK